MMLNKLDSVIMGFTAGGLFAFIYEYIAWGFVGMTAVILTVAGVAYFAVQLIVFFIKKLQQQGG